MPMKNKYLVANPLGTFLVRCNTMEEVEAFVKWHCQRCKESYALCTGRELLEAYYQVKDLTEVPTYTAFNKKRLI